MNYPVAQHIIISVVCRSNKFHELHHCSASLISILRIFTPSSVDGTKLSIFRSRAQNSFCVSLNAVQVKRAASIFFGYLGENLSDNPPSTISLPRPKATFAIPSSAFSDPMG